MMIILFPFLVFLHSSFATPFSRSSPQFKDASTSTPSPDGHLTKPSQPSNVAFFVGNFHSPRRVTNFAKNEDRMNATRSNIINNTSTKHSDEIAGHSGLTKPSVGVIGFQQSFSEPRPVDFGFFPVFPWPKHVSKQVDNLFPRRANNEMWAPPRSDPRLSRFPAPAGPKLPNTHNFGFAVRPSQPVQHVFDRQEERFPKPPTSTTTTPPTTTTSQSTTTSRTETTTFDDSHNHVWNFAALNPSSDFDIVPPTSTTTRKPLGSPPGMAPPDWHGGTHEVGLESTFSKKFKARDPPSRIFTSKSQSAIKKISIFKNEFKKKQNKFHQCRQLSPSSDSILHPKTDKSCEQSLPNFKNDVRCRCRFVVAARDFAGCATKFYSLCFRI